MPGDDDGRATTSRGRKDTAASSTRKRRPARDPKATRRSREPCPTLDYLALAVSNAGGLGSLPCALLDVDGMRAWMGVADRLYQLPVGVIGIAAGTVLLPTMSKRLAAGDEAGGDVAKRAFEAMMEMRKIDVAAIEAAVRG